MLSRSVTKGRIGVSTTPGKDGNASDDEITSTDEPLAQSGENGEDKQRFRQRCSSAISALPDAREGQGTRGKPSLPNGKPQARARAGQARNQSRIS
jgi:hypothetical protein